MPDYSRRAAAALVGVLLNVGCGDSPTVSQRGALLFVVQTIGGDIDVDGYDVVVDGTQRQPVFPSSTVQVSVSPGTHTISIERVAENCTVNGPHPRSVTVESGQMTTVGFEIACIATAIAVTVRTSGATNPDAYVVLVQDRPALTVGANGSVVIGRLQPGRYSVELNTTVEHCTVTDEPRKTVDVSARSTTPVRFDVTCAPPTRRELIAFSINPDLYGVYNTGIGVVRPDGVGREMFGQGHSPAWSPDGAKLVYSTALCDFYYGTGCRGNLVVLDPETRVVSQPVDAHAGYSPAWSPTGDRIAFVRCCTTRVEPPRLYVAKLDGSAAVAVLLPGVISASDPAWSPDGTRLAFTCVIDPSNTDICVSEPDGANAVRLIRGAEGESQPAWSPDGTRIAFTQVTNTEMRILVVRLADGGVSRLTAGDDPAWSPDGTRLVFATPDGLMIINADGTNRTRLTSQQLYEPTWRPTQ